VEVGVSVINGLRGCEDIWYMLLENPIGFAQEK